MVILPKRSGGQIPVMTPNLAERVLVKAGAQCNRWQQDCWYGADQRYTVQAPPDPSYPDVERFAVEMGCPAMDLRYPEGSLVICIPLDAIEGVIELDQPYLIERLRRRGHMQETELSVKTLIADSDNRLHFVTESSDPYYQISLPAFGPSGGDKIRPIALVIGSQQAE